MDTHTSLFCTARHRLLVSSLTALFLCSCGDGGGTTGDPQTPPQGQAAVDSWIAASFYKSWAAEPAVHDARSPSPHGKNRIYSNGVVSKHSTGQYPVGAASVKELFDAAGSNITGYAVFLHTTAGDCKNWYYYEKVNGQTMADGVGAGVCVGCHSGAGSDAAHSGHDCVYTQVK